MNDLTGALLADLLMIGVLLVGVVVGILIGLRLRDTDQEPR
jgi:formate-dependent nitrite reductase membrane component NrfD